ncbi:MAG: 2-octaprenylphenol hydroxylase [Oleiphilaceae bacterium]|jgi:2-octaprenylphenol hydroxylase
MKKSLVKVDIAIVGAGLVGGALAASLKNCGLSIALIDYQTEENLQKNVSGRISVNDFDPRVSALTMASQSLLTELGVWQKIKPSQIQAYQKMKVWDELGTACIEFDSAELYQDSLGCILENQNIISALHSVMSDQVNLKTFLGNQLKSIELIEAEIEADQHLLTLEHGQLIQCKLLVAADGANSKVRQWASMPTREWDYQHEAIVATIKTSKKHQKTAWQRFSESGPLAFLPLADANDTQQFCSIVWSQETARAKSLMALSESDFLKELAESIEFSLGELEAVSARYSIPLRQRHAKTYVKPGIVLLGDAAHTIHPLAGQGVNLGFKDVKALSDILIEADKQNVEVNNMVLLKRYQRQRRGDNLLMMAAMESFKRLFEQPDPFLRWLRNTGMGWVNKQSFLKNQIAKHAMGLSL